MSHRRSLFAITLLLAFTSATSAGEKKALCELEWLTDKDSKRVIEFIFEEKGCSMEGSEGQDCYYFREHNPLSKDEDDWNMGEGVFFAKRDGKTYCIGAKRDKRGARKVVTYSGGENEPLAYLVCDEQGRPKSVELVPPKKSAKTGTVAKSPKLCTLPKDFP